MFQTLGTRELRLLLALAPVVGLLWLSLGNLRAAQALQSRVDQHYVIGYAREALRAPLSQRAGRQLRERVTQLVAQPGLGLTSLSVRDASGLLLASAGRYENLHFSWLPATTLHALREVLYRVTSDFGRALVQDGTQLEPRTLGSFDYAIADSLIASVREPALQRLRWSGWAGLTLGLLLGAWLLWTLRRAASAQGLPQMIGRLGAAVPTARNAPAAPAANPLIDMEVAQALRLRAGGALDQLNYGLLLADKQGQVRYLNTIAENLTGWPLADARQRMVYSVFHAVGAQDQPLVSAAEQSLQDNRAVTAIECRLRARGGGITQIEMMASLLYHADGTHDGVAMLLRDIGPMQQRIEEFRKQSRLSQGVVDHLEEGLLTTDPAGVVRFANARALRMFAYTREEIEGSTVTKLLPVPFLNTPSIKLTDYTGARNSLRLPKVIGWRKDATTFPAELQVQPMNVGGDNGLIVIIRDISERLRSENLATRLGRLLDSALEEVYIFDAQSLYFLEVNRGARKNLGYRQEQLSRMTPLSISAQLEEADFLGYLAKLRGGDAEHLSYRCAHKRSDGSEYPVEVRLNFSREEEPPVFMAIAVDITERQLVEEKLKHLAHHDALTGLPTRTVLHDRLRQALLAASRNSRLVAVCFVDVDLFKQINDTYGHEAGDAVLKCVSERLKSVVRAADTVARLSGDEFVIVATGVRNAEDAENLARKVVESFQRRLEVPGEEMTITVSVGVALYPLDENDAEALLRHADSAMYMAKKEGRNRYRMFSTDIDPDRRRRLDLEREVHAAVALNQYRLVLTPVANHQGALHVCLADVYWEHPRYGNIGKTETLRAATRAGLLADLELWEICNCCAQMHAMVKAGQTPLPVIIGISGWQLRDADFNDHMLYLMQRFEVAPGLLILSLSQDGLTEACNAPPQRIAQLLQRGLRFALRDFTGGFEALNRELAIPFELILLSEDAAPRMQREPEVTAQIRRIIETASATGREVIVPAIADAAMRAHLNSMGRALHAGPVYPDLATPEGALWLAQSPRAAG